MKHWHRGRLLQAQIELRPSQGGKRGDSPIPWLVKLWLAVGFSGAAKPIAHTQSVPKNRQDEIGAFVDLTKTLPIEAHCPEPESSFCLFATLQAILEQDLSEKLIN